MFAEEVTKLVEVRRLKPLSNDQHRLFDKLTDCAANLWDELDRASEYNRGQIELIGDAVQFGGDPADTQYIVNYLVALKIEHRKRQQAAKPLTREQLLNQLKTLPRGASLSFTPEAYALIFGPIQPIQPKE